LKFRAIIGLLVVLAIAGVVYAAIPKTTPSAPVQPRPYVWDFDMEALQTISLTMPKLDQSVSFVKHDDRYFYFDVPNGPKVDMQRWGGGIPLILSGPGADRLLFNPASATNLQECGFNTPNIEIHLTLNDGKAYDIVVADKNPSGTAYYIKMADQAAVYTVDSTWYDVISRLVTDPPYAPASIAVAGVTVTPLEARVGQTVNIAADTVNSGTLAGTMDVVLKVNGEVVETKTVELARDEHKTVLFTITPDQDGVYSINVGGKTAKLTVQ